MHKNLSKNRISMSSEFVQRTLDKCLLIHRWFAKKKGDDTCEKKRVILLTRWEIAGTDQSPRCSWHPSLMKSQCWKQHNLFSHSILDCNRVSSVNNQPMNAVAQHKHLQLPIKSNIQPTEDIRASVVRRRKKILWTWRITFSFSKPGYA